MSTAAAVPPDPFGLFNSAADVRPLLWFGDVDASAAIVGMKTQNAVNSMASADLELDSQAPVLIDVDFTSEVVIARGDKDAGRVFTGYVIEASVIGAIVKVVCQANPALHDPMSGARISRTFPVDNIHALLREGGLPDERLRLAGLDQLPIEVFEAVIPIDGLSLSDRIVLGPVTFLPSGSAGSAFDLLNEPDNPLANEFGSAGAYSVTYVTSARMYEAERAAIDRIDVAVALANVRLRFAGAVSPSGQLMGWRRDRLKQVASRGPLVFLRGLLTNRFWLHKMAPPLATEVALTAEGSRSAGVVASDARLRGALKAVARAITSSDPLTKITAISECLEFYVGATEASYGFTKSERKSLRDAAQTFSAEKKGRVEQLVGSVNDAPLMRKLLFQLAEDGISISDAEMGTLRRVRAQRNDVVHGKTDAVDQTEVQQAVSLLARIMIHANERQTSRMIAG